VVAGYRGTRILVGPPGTGKSWYLADRVPRIVEASGRRLDRDSSPVVICSLTRAAAQEIGSRLPHLPDTVARTAHSHAYRHGLSGADVVDRAIVADWNCDHPPLALTSPKPRRKDSVPDDIVPARKGDQPGDEVAGQYDLFRHRLVPEARMPPRVQRFARRWEAFKRERGCVDFTDMLVHAGTTAPLGAEVVVVDEAQDLSRLMWQVVLAWAEDAGGLIAVGDPWQALYDPWAGASAAAFLQQFDHADEHAILSQSWRVPAAVHRVATRFVRALSDYRPTEYEPRRQDGPGTPFVEGRVVRCDATWTDPRRAVDEAERLAAAGKRVLFAFSANYMTRPLCQLLRERAAVFSNPWREDEPLWNPLRGGAGGAAATLLDPGRRWTAAGIHDWTRPLRATGLLRRGMRAEIEKRENDSRQLGLEEIRRWFVDEARDGVARLASAGSDAALLVWWRERLATKYREAGDYAAALIRARGVEALRAPSLLHPSTIHGCKGGEADHVFLFPDLSPMADEAWAAGGRFRDPVVRAFYVGITRARECLHLCAPATRRFVEFPR